MKNYRKYGNSLFDVAVIHGGPEAAGEMEPVARKLSIKRGVLEPLQTADTLEGQVEELYFTLKNHGRIPSILIGHSWGAMLIYIMASRYPEAAKKLILVSSGPFEKKYAENLMKTRISRLTDEEKSKIDDLLTSLNNREIGDKDGIMMEFGRLLSKADSFDPLPDKNEVQCRFQLFQKVWARAEALRENGELLRMGKNIICPVTAIHGDYDPHPADGVRLPLTTVISGFRFHLLANCGHTPWLEKQAKDRFYELLEDEIGIA